MKTKKRISMFVDLPLETLAEVTALLQSFAKDRKEIILVISSTSVIPEKMQESIKEIVNKVLKTENTDSDDIIGFTERVMKNVGATYDVIKFRRKDTEYIG